MSEVKVNKVSPRSGTGVQLGDAGDTITVPASANLTVGGTLTATTGGGVANAALANSAITINGSAVNLGGSVTIGETYFLRIENNDGNAVRSGTALLTVSDVPAWVTGAGSLGTFSGGDSFGTITLTATDSVSMAKVSGTFPGGMTLNSGSGSSTLTGTESGATSDTTYSFTIRATDAQGQTADRAFTITVNLGANNSGQFN
jgi:hypothetical protein